MTARPSIEAIVAAAAAEHALSVEDILGRSRDSSLAKARRDIVWLALQLGWRQRDVLRPVRLGSSAVAVMASRSAVEHAQPAVRERHERLLAALSAGPAPAGEALHPAKEAVPPRVEADPRQDRLHELVELFTAVVTRIDQRLDQIAAAVTAADASVGHLRFLLSAPFASPVQPRRAEPSPQEPDAELLAAAAAAAEAAAVPVPPLATAPLALPPDVLVEGEMTPTRAARLLRSRDYAPVIETAPDAWTVGAKRMTTVEMVAMAEALRQRLLSQRRVA